MNSTYLNLYFLRSDKAISFGIFIYLLWFHIDAYKNLFSIYLVQRNSSTSKLFANIGKRSLNLKCIL